MPAEMPHLTLYSMPFNCKNICNNKNSSCLVVRVLIKHSVKIILKKFNLIPGMLEGLTIGMFQQKFPFWGR